MFHSQTKRSTAAQVAFSCSSPLRPTASHLKGHIAWLALVLSRTGKAEMMQNRIISDMISSMEIERTKVYVNNARMDSEHCSGGLSQFFQNHIGGPPASISLVRQTSFQPRPRPEDKVSFRLWYLIPNICISHPSL